MKRLLIIAAFTALTAAACAVPPPAGPPPPPADGTCHEDPINGDSIMIVSHQGTAPQVWWDISADDWLGYESSTDCTGPGISLGPANIVWGPTSEAALANCITNVGGIGVSPAVPTIPTLTGSFVCF